MPEERFNVSMASSAEWSTVYLTVWLHQSFGEVNAISREPNGHLYVDFRKAEVAETVCRARTSPAYMTLTFVRLLGMSFASASLYQGCRQRLLILLHGQEALSRFVISA